MKNKSLLMTIAIIMIAMNSFAQVKDKDGNIYKTVKIATQEWMAENLDVSHFRNGDIIPEVKDSAAWLKAGREGKPAWCYYANDPANEKKYGKLYNWFATNDTRGLAPDGWHVPSTSEWVKLTDYLGGEDVAGGKMKYTAGWESNGNGTNESGFAALPGACRYAEDGTFLTIEEFGYWWTSTEINNSDAWGRYLTYLDGIIDRDTIGKGSGRSVRCVRD